MEGIGAMGVGGVTAAMGSVTREEEWWEVPKEVMGVAKEEYKGAPGEAVAMAVGTPDRHRYKH